MPVPALHEQQSLSGPGSHALALVLTPACLPCRPPAVNNLTDIADRRNVEPLYHSVKDYM